MKMGRRARRGEGVGTVCGEGEGLFRGSDLCYLLPYTRVPCGLWLELVPNKNMHLCNLLN